MLLVSVTLSCASSNVFHEIDYAVGRSDFAAALEVIERAQEGRNVLYNERNSISLFLDKGLLEHYARNFPASIEHLRNAERLIAEAYTRRISEGFMSYITNDNAKEYPGEDFEDIYVNVFNAINFYKRGNLESALVEIRRLTISSGKLDMLARRHEYVDPNTGANLNTSLERETGSGSQLPPTTASTFSNSALARYLGAIFYQAIGNVDSARIEFDQVPRAFSTNRAIYPHEIPQAVEASRNANIPSGKARLNIISFTGLSPIKVEETIEQSLPFRHPMLRTAKFKIPVLQKRPSEINRVEVVVSGNQIETQRFNLELLEDMGIIIEDTFKNRYANILLRTFARALIKYAVADIAAMEVANRQGALAGIGVAAAARTALEASEGADIRMARFLPEKALIGGINLDPGTYSVIINYYHNNRVIGRDEHREVSVAQRGLNLIQSVNLQ
jgi:hypothetical protein